MRVTVALVMLGAAVLQAQSEISPAAPAPRDDSSDQTFWSRFWISGQANFIRQDQPAFYAKYSGPNSLSPGTDHATSRVLTLFTGFEITRYLEILADVESAGGAGISNALGLAGFTNVDVVRNPTLGTAPYIARVMLHYTVPLSREMTGATRNPLSLASEVPVRRIELRFGKMSTVDFFDNNAIGSDSHLQFMNWAVVNNGAFDYAADTRGYTYGLLAEYYGGFGVFRFGQMLMPTVANGLTLDWNIARAGAQHFEWELHPVVFKKHATVLRPLAYINHANMGNYREAIHGYFDDQTHTPDITAYRKQDRVKYGFGWNVEQSLSGIWRAYGRLGWNDGHTEVICLHRDRPHGLYRHGPVRKALGPSGR